MSPPPFPHHPYKKLLDPYKKNEKEVTASLSQLSGSLSFFLLPNSFASYLDALFFLSSVGLKIQINSLVLISDFPQDPASETLLSTLLCSLQASNNLPQAPGIPYPTNSSQSPACKYQTIKQLRKTETPK